MSSGYVEMQRQPCEASGSEIFVLRGGHDLESNYLQGCRLWTRFQEDPVRRNGRLKSDRKGLKFARADVALVDARASRGRKARKLFEEDGLFSK